jgi:hypothetical protein
MKWLNIDKKAKFLFFWVGGEVLLVFSIPYLFPSSSQEVS